MEGSLSSMAVTALASVGLQAQPAGWLWLLPAFPLAGFALNALFGLRLQRHLGRAAVHRVAIGAMALAWGTAAWAFVQLVALSPWLRALEQPLWRPGGDSAEALQVMGGLQFGLLLDPLSMTLVAIITTIGLLIHVYATGYMADDPGYWRFFAFLNLFVAAMLLLVMADGLFTLFFGWEGVGLASWGLIGFWYEDTRKAGAALKAFVVNRIGDLGLLLGMFLLFSAQTGAFGYAGELRVPSLAFAALDDSVALFQQLEVAGVPVLTLACLCLVAGAAAKSAQLPLYLWLPDAMAGPTPVSALIHAATMVTAGVYLVARMSGLFVHSPAALTVIATIGAATALFAATVAAVQHDLKKVLAWSTISQLGFMFLAVGVGAFWAGVYHLLTHAFFKACLFLASGAVIQASHHEQDMRKMGGLAQVLPSTAAAWFYASLCMTAAPLFFVASGFYSKDEILFSAFRAGGNLLFDGRILWAMGLLAAGLTAFYMWRAWHLVFRGESRSDHAPALVPRAMSTVVVLLAFGCALTIAVGFWEPLHLPPLLATWLGPSLPAAELISSRQLAVGPDLVWVLMGASVVVALGGWGTARLLYGSAGELPALLADQFAGLHRTLLHGYHLDRALTASAATGSRVLARAFALFDEVVLDGVPRGLAWCARAIARIDDAIDTQLVDGVVNWLSASVLEWGRRARSLQTGSIHGYLYGALGGAVAFVFVSYLLR